MSMIGFRGTLRSKYISSETDGNFLGKSGTLSGVRSLSGYFYTPKGMYIVSIILNDNLYDPNIFTDILNTIYLDKSRFTIRIYCPSYRKYRTFIIYINSNIRVKSTLIISSNL